MKVYVIKRNSEQDCEAHWEFVEVATDRQSAINFILNDISTLHSEVDPVVGTIVEMEDRVLIDAWEVDDEGVAYQYTNYSAQVRAIYQG